MLKLVDLPETAEKAIRSNFAMRNSRSCADAGRHARTRATRRHQIREWLAVLRIVRNPAMAEGVAAALKSVGALMAHDLRNRIILVGLDYQLAAARQRSPLGL